MGTERRRRTPGGLEAEVLGTLWAAEAPLSPSEVRDALDQAGHVPVRQAVQQRARVDDDIRAERNGGREGNEQGG